MRLIEKNVKKLLNLVEILQLLGDTLYQGFTPGPHPPGPLKQPSFPLVYITNITLLAVYVFKANLNNVTSPRSKLLLRKCIISIKRSIIITVVHRPEFIESVYRSVAIYALSWLSLSLETFPPVLTKCYGSDACQD